MKRLIYFFIFVFNFTTILFLASIIYYFSPLQKINLQNDKTIKIISHKILLCGNFENNKLIFVKKNDQTLAFLPITDNSGKLRAILAFNSIYLSRFDTKKRKCYKVLKPTFWNKPKLPSEFSQKNIELFIYYDYKTGAKAFISINLITAFLTIIYVIKFYKTKI